MADGVQGNLNSILKIVVANPNNANETGEINVNSLNDVSIMSADGSAQSSVMAVFQDSVVSEEEFLLYSTALDDAFANYVSQSEYSDYEISDIQYIDEANNTYEYSPVGYMDFVSIKNK